MRKGQGQGPEQSRAEQGRAENDGRCIAEEEGRKEGGEPTQMGGEGGSHVKATLSLDRKRGEREERR